jgi:hypothetical protein
MSKLIVSFTQTDPTTMTKDHVTITIPEFNPSVETCLAQTLDALKKLPTLQKNEVIEVFRTLTPMQYRAEIFNNDEFQKILKNATPDE